MGVKQLFPDEADYMALAEPQLQSIKKIGEHLRFIREMIKELVDKRKEANQINDISERAEMYSTVIKPYIEEVRYHIDKLELIVDNKMWPLPKYRELLFIR
jgi:glutamine synthetase